MNAFEKFGGKIEEINRWGVKSEVVKRMDDPSYQMEVCST